MEQQETVPVPAESLSGAEWLAARRKEVQEGMKLARAARAEEERAKRDTRRVAGKKISAALRAKKSQEPSEPPTPEEIAKDERRKDKRRERDRIRIKKWRRKRNANDPAHQRRKNVRKQKRYRRKEAAKAAHARAVARHAAAEAKRIAKAERRAQLERIAAEKEQVRQAQGLPSAEKKRTPTQKRIDEAYARGVQDGIRLAREMAVAEAEAKTRPAA